MGKNGSPAFNLSFKARERRYKFGLKVVLLSLVYFLEDIFKIIFYFVSLGTTTHLHTDFFPF